MTNNFHPFAQVVSVVETWHTKRDRILIPASKSLEAWRMGKCEFYNSLEGSSYTSSSSWQCLFWPMVFLQKHPLPHLFYSVLLMSGQMMELSEILPVPSVATRSSARTRGILLASSSDKFWSVDCPPYLASCNGVCTDVLNNPSHCGSCNHQVPSGQYCSQGRPVASGSSEQYVIGGVLIVCAIGFLAIGSATLVVGVQSIMRANRYAKYLHDTSHVRGYTTGKVTGWMPLLILGTIIVPFLISIH